MPGHIFGNEAAAAANPFAQSAQVGNIKIAKSDVCGLFSIELRRQNGYT